MAALSSRGVSLAEEERALQANGALTAARIKEVLARYVVEPGRFELIAMP